MLSFICVSNVDLLPLNRDLGLGTARVHHWGPGSPPLFSPSLHSAPRASSLTWTSAQMPTQSVWPRDGGPGSSAMPLPRSSLRLCAPSPYPALLCVTAASVQASRDAPKISRPFTALPLPPRVLTVSLGGTGGPSPQDRLCCSAVADPVPSHPAPKHTASALGAEKQFPMSRAAGPDLDPRAAC